MEQLRQQVSRARRRMIIQQFLGIATWTLFWTLLLALIGVTVVKIWALNVDAWIWSWSWIGGAMAVGLLAAIVWTWCVRCPALDAAIEIDRRFALKERISSSLALTERERQSEAGRALLDDAIRRAQGIEVTDQFHIRFSRRNLLPVFALMAVVSLVFVVSDARENQANAANQTQALEKQLIKKSTEDLKKQIEKRREQAVAKGLKDASELFKQLQEGIDELNKMDDVDRKQALVKMNDLAKSLAERRQQLGSSSEMQKQLDKLKDIQKGPADKVAQALQQGDFQKALEEIQKLHEQLKKGELNEEQARQLAKQLEEMQRQMQQMAEDHQRAKQELERKIQQKLEEGDLKGAGQLQRKLDQLRQQDQQMQRMMQMANQMGDCAQCLKNGNQQQAAGQLSQMMDELENLQEQLDELAALDEILDQIADAKDAMNGDGLEGLDGMGFGNEDMGQPGMGLGKGQGRGERPEEETDANFYQSKVGAKPQKGPAVAVGRASGPNLPGKSKEAVKQQIESSLRDRPDPLTDQRLPRDQRDHTREYYQRFLKGE